MNAASLLGQPALRGQLAGVLRAADLAQHSACTKDGCPVVSPIPACLPSRRSYSFSQHCLPRLLCRALCVCVCTPQSCSLCWTSNNECLKVATRLPHMPCRLLLPLFSHCKPQMGLSPYASEIVVHRGTSHFCNLLAVCSWHVRPHR